MAAQDAVFARWSGFYVVGSVVAGVGVWPCGIWVLRKGISGYTYADYLLRFTHSRLGALLFS